MTITADNYQPLGKTGLRIPPVAFRGGILANTDRVIAEQTLRIICAEWFQQVAPPVHIAMPLDGTLAACLEFLATTLKRHEIDPQNVLLNLQNHAVEPSLERMLDHAESARLLSHATSLKPLITCNMPAVGDGDAGALAELAELRARERIAGFGIRTADWQLAKKCTNSDTPDFVELVGEYTIVRHPPELCEYLDELSRRQIAVIAAGVFHGGFLVGGPRFDHRIPDPDDSANNGLIAWRKAFTSLCHGHGVRPAHVCIQFALRAPATAAVSLSTKHAERVREAVQGVTQPVPNAFWESLWEEGLLEEDFRLPAG